MQVALPRRRVILTFELALSLPLTYVLTCLTCPLAIIVIKWWHWFTILKLVSWSLLGSVTWVKLSGYLVLLSFHLGCLTIWYDKSKTQQRQPPLIQQMSVSFTLTKLHLPSQSLVPDHILIFILTRWIRPLTIFGLRRTICSLVLNTLAQRLQLTSLGYLENKNFLLLVPQEH